MCAFVLPLLISLALLPRLPANCLWSTPSKTRTPKPAATLIAPHGCQRPSARWIHAASPGPSIKTTHATVDLLLKAGAKVTVADEYGETPLTLACANGDAAIVEKLLKAGADPNAARFYNETRADDRRRQRQSRRGSCMLLAHGAKIDAVEERQRPERTDVGRRPVQCRRGAGSPEGRARTRTRLRRAALRRWFSRPRTATRNPPQP